METAVLKFTQEPAWRSSMFPTYRVEIPTGGEGTIAVTSKDHVSFDCNHHCINGRPGDRCWIVYRGVEYGSHMHFNLKDGKWVNGEYPHATKVHSSKVNDGSPAAIRWIQDTMREIVEQFHMTHPEVFARAERERIERELENKRNELREAAEQAAALELKIEALEQELCDWENS